MDATPKEGWQVLEYAVDLSRRGERFVLASVVWRQGPSSGKEGARAIVTDNGSTYGWIGGACAEPVLIRESLAALEDGRSRLLLLGMDEFADELPPGMIAVPISCSSEGALQVHIEPILPTPTVVVIGESPMAHTLVDLVNDLGWRGALADPKLAVDIPKSAAVVVATQGHGDEEILLQVMAARPPYVGLVASAKRGAAIRDYLSSHGVPGDVVSVLRAPAGLDLGPTSHREMAASILAELVAARAQGDLDTRKPVASAKPATAIDPICGMEVAADESSRPFEYRDETYYFCCPACRSTFESDPETHLRRIHADHE
ncbi:MAG: XdhC family protein [Acidimicrobiia bacterium]|nr:XdhC family protein [Acidimicrobiia bacterium]